MNNDNLCIQPDDSLSKKKKSKFNNDQERLESIRQSNLKSQHKRRYTKEKIEEMVAKYRERLMAKMIVDN
jgi:hypothetical protein